MKYNLLFLDVDGTLIHKTNPISNENKSAIKKACECGVKITIASGRCKAMTMALSRELGLNNYGNNYSISLNGALIADNISGSTLNTVPMDFDLCGKLFMKAQELCIDSHFYSENFIYHKHKDKTITSFYEQYDCGSTSISNPYIDIKETPLKYILIDNNHHRLELFKREMLPYTNGILNAEFSSPRSLEYYSISASKGLGVEYVTDLFNEDLSNTIAMGDGENDISMLTTAGLSIAPKNALENVKSIADFITKNSCENHAVKEVIEHFLLV